jgi:glucose/arabinose dehydrogenase
MEPRTVQALRHTRPTALVGRIALALLLAVPLLGLPGGSASAATITWTRRAAGLDQPTQVTSAHDGTGRLFVVEKSGRVRVFRNGRLQPRVYLDLRSRVRNVGEGGLLSIAFHPRWRTHPYLWAAYADSAGDLRVSRFKAAGFRASSVRASTARQVIDVPHPDANNNHYGGQLVFGHGGFLFLSTGDGGAAGDPLGHGQSKATLQGKILRLRVIGARAACGRLYCVPGNNPFAGRRPGRGEIWLVGLRNAWRYSVDASTGDLWIGDVGQDTEEEVDHVRKGVGGLNLGWSCREGNRVFNSSRCRGQRFTAPVFTYGRSFGNSITGGFVYRGTRFRSVLGGRYVGADFGSGRVFHSTPGGLVTAGTLEGVTSFGETGGRELWAVTLNGGLWEMTGAG